MTKPEWEILQSKKRLWQASATDHDIPEGVGQDICAHCCVEHSSGREVLMIGSGRDQKSRLVRCRQQNLNQGSTLGGDDKQKNPTR